MSVAKGNEFKLTTIRASIHGTAVRRITEADYTGLKELQQNAPLHRSFALGNQIFDGNRVENFSDRNPDTTTLKKMSVGTVIMKIKATANTDNPEVLLGLKNNQADLSTNNDINGGSLKDKNTAAILLKNNRNIRYSFDHTRANGTVALIPGEWTTVVFTNAGPESGKVLCLYINGNSAGNFSGSGNAGFFGSTDVDLENASVTIGGLISPDGRISSGFKGEIAYMTITPELLTDKEAQEISMGTGESDILRVFNTADASNTWVITGGRNAQGKYENIETVRNYGGLFKEVIRWDQSGNSINGLQRFVMNTAREDYNITTIVNNYDNLIQLYQPKGVAVMLDEKDLELGRDSIVSSLKKLIDLNLAGDEPIYTVIQLPVPTLDPQKNETIEELVSGIDFMIQELESFEAKKVVMVNHYQLLKSADMEDLLNENGSLNAKGHLEVANQLLAATIGNLSKINTRDLENTPIPSPALDDQAPKINVMYDRIIITVPTVEGVSGWNYELDLQGTLLKGFMGTEKSIHFLPSGVPFELSMVSNNQKLRLPVMTGTIRNGETAVQKIEDRELTQLQQELQNKLDSPNPMKWLFLGDTITQGSVHTKGYDSVPQLMEKYIREELGRNDDVIINTSVSDATTANFANNKEVRFGRYQDADVVVLMFGTNDANNQIVGAGNYRQNLESIIDEIKNQGAIPIIRTPNIPAGSIRTNLSKYVNVIKSVAKENGIVLADHYKRWETALDSRSYLNTTDKYWQNDSTNPNRAGQLIMAQEFNSSYGD